MILSDLQKYKTLEDYRKGNPKGSVDPKEPSKAKLKRILLSVKNRLDQLPEEARQEVIKHFNSSIKDLGASYETIVEHYNQSKDKHSVKSSIKKASDISRLLVGKKGMDKTIDIFQSLDTRTALNNLCHNN